MILEALLVSLAIQIVLFIPAFILQTDKLTDLSYSLTFALLAIIYYFFNSDSLLKIILLVMIIIWSIRLMLYLFKRILKMKKDKRFDGIRENFFKFLGFWIFQGVLVWVILLPMIYFMEGDVKLTILSVVGIIIWIIGLIIEAIADNQKFKFKSNNKGLIKTGLWKYSRHPNYFGEILLWFGVYIFTLSSLINLEVYIALLSPIILGLMIYFFSGIPLLENRYQQKYGQEWENYKRTTSNLIPWFKK